MRSSIQTVDDQLLFHDSLQLAIFFKTFFSQYIAVARFNPNDPQMLELSLQLRSDKMLTNQNELNVVRVKVHYFRSYALAAAERFTDFEKGNINDGVVRVYFSKRDDKGLFETLVC